MHMEVKCMNMTDVFSAPTPARILLCCAENEREDMVSSFSAALPDDLRDRAHLNDTPLLSMDLAGNEPPDRFSDLLRLCGRLISAAHYRSHFEGLLLLNITDLIDFPIQETRLKALGELLAMPDGVASRCLTVIYGPENDRELLQCANALDFDGRLRVGFFEQDRKKHALADLLLEHSLRCTAATARTLLTGILSEMSAYPGFSAAKLLCSCANVRGLITESAIRRHLQDPYSYLNRIKRTAQLKGELSRSRVIGFQA